MKCACDFDNDSNAKFCGRCGSPLPVPEAGTEAPPARQQTRSTGGDPRARSVLRSNLRTGAILVVLVGAWVGYYFFLRTDPVTDGERAAAEFCRCARESRTTYSSTMKEYLAGFDGRHFKRQRAAREALTAMLAPANTKREECHKRAEVRMSELKERYLADKEQLEKYEYALMARRKDCSTIADTTELEALTADVESKINGISDLESDVNSALAAEYGAKYRVVTDQDRKWDKHEFDTFVIPEREKFEYYPYIVKGDFDGDKVSDLAAEVVNTENNYHRLAVVWGGSHRLSFYDGQLCSALSFAPANEWKSHWEEAAVTLAADAIMVSCYEKSAWLLYWTGRGFAQYWISD